MDRSCRFVKNVPTQVFLEKSLYFWPQDLPKETLCWQIVGQKHGDSHQKYAFLPAVVDVAETH